MTIQEMIVAEADAQGFDSQLALAVAKQESNFNPNAVSPVGAQGVFQLMPATAAGLGVTNAFDPAQNIAAGIRYLGQMLSMFGGDATKALAAYNWGPGNVQKALKTWGEEWLNHLPPETANYLQRILGTLNDAAGATFSMTVLGTPLMPDWMLILLALGATYLAVRG